MSESVLQQLSLYNFDRPPRDSEEDDDDNDDEGGRDARPAGDERGEEDGGGKEDEAAAGENEDEDLKEETESERAARKEREEEEQREYEEEARRSKERRSKLDRLSLKDYEDDEWAICCSGVCGATTRFHPCACLAPVRQDPILYEALLEKRRAEHPEWYIDPYGLEDDDHINRIMGMLMGDVSEEEVVKLLESIMAEEENKEEEELELESVNSDPETLSRASSPGTFNLSDIPPDSESSIGEEDDEEYRWPKCREFNVELGLKAIEDFIETKWNLPDHYKFCVDFLGAVMGPPEQYVEDNYYRAKFSVPTRLDPIPLQRAAVHFIISVMLHHDRPREEKVYVAYYMESKRTRFSAETPFRIEWLQMVMESKQRLADDWGCKRTNLYQYVLDGPESIKKKESVPISSTDSQGFWVPNY